MCTGIDNGTFIVIEMFFITVVLLNLYSSSYFFPMKLLSIILLDHNVFKSPITRDNAVGAWQMIEPLGRHFGGGPDGARGQSLDTIFSCFY